MRRWLIIGALLCGIRARASADSVQPIVPISQVTYGSVQKLLTSNSDVTIDTTTHQLSANKGIHVTTITWANGSISTGPSSGGSVGISLGGRTIISQASVVNFDTATFLVSPGTSNIANVTSKVDTTTAVVNYAYLFNGTNAVWAPQGSNFTFAIASFSDGLAGTQEIGTGVWKSAGGINFTASYTNGPPIGSTITFSGWSALPLSSPFTAVTSVANVSYPSILGTVVFTLSSQKSISTSASVTHTFNNDRYWGVNSISTGVYSSADIRALASNDLSNSIPNTFAVNPGSGQYIVYAYPSRLGTATFTVNGFSGGFNAPVSTTVTNASGFAETYSVYSSINSNLGSTTVTVTTP